MLEAAGVFVQGQLLRCAGECAFAKAGEKAASYVVCGWRVGDGEEFDCGEVRCVPDAWGCAGGRWGEDRRYAGEAREAWAGADDVWRGRVCDCKGLGGGGVARGGPNYGCEAVGARIFEL